MRVSLTFFTSDNDIVLVTVKLQTPDLQDTVTLPKCWGFSGPKNEAHDTVCNISQYAGALLVRDFFALRSEIGKSGIG